MTGQPGAGKARMHLVDHSPEVELEPATDPEPSPAPTRPARQSQGVMVELVRLVTVVFFALGGWEISNSMSGNRAEAMIPGIVLGSCIGYVTGGILGRGTVSAVSHAERELQRMPAADILAGGIGLTLGLVMASLASFPLFRLPPAAAIASVAFVYAAFGYLGSRMGRSRSEELFGLFGVKPRAAGSRPGEVTVLDTSAILDQRTLALVEMGFLGGTLLVPREVLDELQAVADSSDPGRRARGRRGLDLLLAVKRAPAVELVVVDEPPVLGEPVDSRLVRLAKSRGGALVTNDAALAKVAAAMDVPVRSIHALADALRADIHPGEETRLRLTRRGREVGQAVGYLEDGTMVVVAEADHLLGETVTVHITNATTTSSGHLLFARLPSDD